MKYSEMDRRQKRAYKNIMYACNELIGSLENGLMDFPEDSEEYKKFESELNNHEELVSDLYNNSLNYIYDEGMVSFGDGAKRELQDIKFCGKEFLMGLCEYFVKDMGY